MGCVGSQNEEVSYFAGWTDCVVEGVKSEICCAGTFSLSKCE